MVRTRSSFNSPAAAVIMTALPLPTTAAESIIPSLPPSRRKSISTPTMQVLRQQNQQQQQQPPTSLLAAQKRIKFPSSSTSSSKRKDEIRNESMSSAAAKENSDVVTNVQNAPKPPQPPPSKSLLFQNQHYQYETSKYSVGNPAGTTKDAAGVAASTRTPCTEAKSSSKTMIDDILSIPDPLTPQDVATPITSGTNHHQKQQQQQQTELILEMSRRNRRNSRRISSSLHSLPLDEKMTDPITTTAASSTATIKLSKMLQGGPMALSSSKDKCTIDDATTTASVDSVAVPFSGNSKDSDDSNMDWEESIDGDDITITPLNNKHKMEQQFVVKPETTTSEESEYLPSNGSIVLDDSSCSSSSDSPDCGSHNNRKEEGEDRSTFKNRHKDSSYQQHQQQQQQHRCAPKHSRRQSELAPPLLSSSRRTSIYRRNDDNSHHLDTVSTSTSSSSSLSTTKTFTGQISREGKLHYPTKNSHAADNNHKKRSRQSLLLPIDTHKTTDINGDTLIHRDGENSTPKKKKSKQSRKSMVLPSQNNLHFDHDDDNDDENDDEKFVKLRASKKRKARKSMLLPVQFNEDIKSDIQTKNPMTEEHKSVSKPSWDEINICPDKLRIVKELIRKFCATPLEERYKSTDAVIVEELSGYPLISATDKSRRDRENMGIDESTRAVEGQSQDENDGSNNGVPKNDEQAALMVRRRVFSKMGPMIAVMEARKKVDTEVMEAGTGCRVEKKRGGKFRYIDLFSGHKVSTSVYEKRYLSTLRRLRHAREERRRIAVAAEEGSTSDESVPTTNTDETESDDNKCDAVSFPESHINRTDSGKSETKKELLDEVELPSRNDMSEDPDIAAAQVVLFDSIDTALRQYSDAVFEIRGRRKLGNKE